jgi:hypothetical protein
MSGLFIALKDKTDIKLFTDLANRIGVQVRNLSDEEILDIGLLKAMEEGKFTRFVPRERIMKKLRRSGD